MKRTCSLKVGILILAVLMASLMTGISFSSEDILYNPSQEFLNDFFTALQGGGEKTTAETSSALVLRRLHSISELVNRDDKIGAWQTLINLPDVEGLDVISEIKREAVALQSAIPWYGDGELKKNFISAFEDIWLKNDKLDDYGTFKKVFGGYASRRVGANPAVFIRDNIGYYGYTKGSGQPQEDLQFIWNLFKDFSLLAGNSGKSGQDYHSLDLSLMSDEIITRTASRIDESLSFALAKERERKGIVKIEESGSSAPEGKVILSEEIALKEDEIPVEKKTDYSSLNIFRLPEDVGSEWVSGESQAMDIIPSEEEVASETIPEVKEAEPPAVVNPLETLGGLEPPETPPENKKPSIVKIPKVEEAKPLIDIPVKEETSEQEKPKDEISKEEIVEEIEIGTSIPELTPEGSGESKNKNEVVESIYKSPEIAIVEPVKETTVEKQETVQIPHVEEKEVEKAVVPDDTAVSQEVDLLKTSETLENKVEEKAKVEIISGEPPKPDTEIEQPPAEAKVSIAETPPTAKEIVTQPDISETVPESVETPVLETNEIAGIAQEFTDKIISSGQELGRLTVDLVILWSKDPATVKDYTTQESNLEEQFRIKKEEFLAMLFIEDTFRLEEDLSMTFDTYNGLLIGAMMKGFDEFKAKGGFADNPNITEEELLRAISQLTEGVQSRRDSVKIQNSSLKAFRLRRSQFTEVIDKLEKLKKSKITD